MDNILGGNEAVRELARAVTWEKGILQIKAERAAALERLRRHEQCRDALAKLAEKTNDYREALDKLEPWVRKPWRGQDFFNIRVPINREPKR